MRSRNENLRTENRIKASKKVGSESKVMNEDEGKSKSTKNGRG